MERGTFLQRGVQKEFRRFVEIRLHTDGQDPKHSESSQRNRRYQAKRFKTIALPYYALLSPDGETVYWHDGGAKSAREFVDRLRSVPSAARETAAR